MPPPARVCQACKASKVRCAGPFPAQSCSRCSRLGLRCDPAKQAPKAALIAKRFALPSSYFHPGKRPREEEREAEASTLSMCTTDTLAVSLSSSDIQPDCMIWERTKALNSIEEETFVLRHMAAVAKSRNAYELLSKVVARSCSRGIALKDVLEPLIDPLVDSQDPNLSSFDFEILQIVSESAGYCQARAISPMGSSKFFHNAAFEGDIVSLDACERAYARNKDTQISLWLHADDIATMNSAMAETFQKALRASKYGRNVAHTAGERPVRIFHRRLGAHLPCHLHCHLMVTRETGKVCGVFELLPFEGALNGPMPELPRIEEVAPCTIEKQPARADVSPRASVSGHEARAPSPAGADDDLQLLDSPLPIQEFDGLFDTLSSTSDFPALLEDQSLAFAGGHL
jgi:hypothetical protein